eukprot:UN09811
MRVQILIPHPSVVLSMMLLQVLLFHFLLTITILHVVKPRYKIILVVIMILITLIIITTIIITTSNISIYHILHKILVQMLQVNMHKITLH